jgi:hypothetical protein
VLAEIRTISPAIPPQSQSTKSGRRLKDVGLTYSYRRYGAGLTSGLGIRHAEYEGVGGRISYCVSLWRIVAGPGSETGRPIDLTALHCVGFHRTRCGVTATSSCIDASFLRRP